jgi:hypothetical protein
MLRRLGLLLAFGVSAALLGGCVAYKDVIPTQDGVGVPVRIQLTVCVNEIGATQQHAGCSFDTNRPFEAANDDYQVLLGFRVPAGVTAPQAFASTAGESLTFTRSPSYEAELNRLKPPPAGETWVGYLSSQYTLAYAGAEPARQSTVALDLALPRSADGAPFQGPFAYMPVVGGREVGDPNEPKATDPVVCGPGVNGDPVACVDYPLEAQMDSNFNFPTRDFGIVTGKATASPGQTVTLPFGVRGAGVMPAGLSATLAATTTLPGAAVAPSAPTAALTTGMDTRVTVPVTIPAHAPPGVFDVALTGRLDNGQTRTGVAKLTVRDRQKPVVSKLGVKPKAFKAATKRKPKRGTNVSYALSEVASVRVVVERCAKYAKPKRGSRKGRRAGAGATARKRATVRRGRCTRFAAMRGARTLAGRAGANSFRFNGRLRGRALKAGSYRLVLTATDPAGNVGDKVRAPFAIRR